MNALRNRYVLLHHFTELLTSSFALFGLDNRLNPELDKLRPLLMMDTKDVVFRKVIQSTMVRDVQYGPVFELNRMSRLRKKSESQPEAEGAVQESGDFTNTVFGQMVSRMHLLTKECLLLAHRVWKVKLLNVLYILCVQISTVQS